MVLKVEVGNDVEQLFREAAMRTYGYQKGALQKAFKEAIHQWTLRHAHQKEDMFADMKMHSESVAKKLWGTKADDVWDTL
jgi:hypothetical protein